MEQEPQQNNNQPYTAPDTSQSEPTPPPSPSPKKKWMLVALTVVVVAALAIAAFALMNPGKNNSATNKTTDNTSNPSTPDTKYKNYDVTDKGTGIVYSVSFYKDAEIIEKNGRTFLNVGEEGSQSSVYLVAGKEGKIDCGNSPSTTMRLNGESTTICYKADGTQYGGYVTVKGATLQLNVAGQKPISMDEAKTIMESATFK